MKWLKDHPTIIIGVVASLGLLINQAVVGTVTWVVVVPAAVALVLHSLVAPAAPGWIARNGVVIGLVVSLAVVAGQLLDGTVTPIVALPLVLGVFAKLTPAPDAAKV